VLLPVFMLKMGISSKFGPYKLFIFKWLQVLNSLKLSLFSAIDLAVFRVIYPSINVKGRNLHKFELN